MEFHEKTFPSQANFHLTGIIPIAGQSLDFEMPYPDCMLPVASNYTLLEAAVVECAFAGCDTIWIVCNDDIEPIVRYRVGDYIQDPLYFYNTLGPKPSSLKRRIPIFWAPVHPKDRDRRDCLSWSVIYGALTAFKVAARLSTWMIPDKYYVSFPYGIFDPRFLDKKRKLIKTQKNFYVSYHGKTVQDNQYTSFTFGKEEFIEYRRNVRKGTGKYRSVPDSTKRIPVEPLPIEERWSARNFELKDVFQDLDLENATIHEPRQFSNVSSWEQYRDFMKTELAHTIKRPTKDLFKYSEFNRIATDIGE